MERTCIHQVSFGGEPSCCRLKWCQVQQGGRLPQKEGEVPTICDHSLGTECRDGEEAQRNLQIPVGNHTQLRRPIPPFPSRNTLR